MRRILVRALAVVLAAAALATGWLAWSGYRFLHRIQAPPVPEPVTANRTPPPARPSRGLTVLLVGIDARGSEASRADAIVVIRVDPVDRRAAVVSIPRDSRVPIPGHGLDKINHAHAYGGPRILRTAVGEFLGVPIDRYVRVNFRGFRRVIDRLGGIEVTVDRPMEEVFVNVLDEPVKLVRLGPGRQWLNGEQATLFVHDRHDRDGDLARIRRHQQVLAAVWRRVLAPAGLIRIPAILDEIGGAIETDLTPRELIFLARLSQTIPAGRVAWRVIGGHAQTINGISYWIPDPATVRSAARDLGVGQ